MDDEPKLPGCTLPPVAVTVMLFGGAALWCGMFKLAAALLRATMGAGL